MFFCEYIDDLDPSACCRMSRALCLFRPVGVNDDVASRRWDSSSSLCSAKSFFRFAVSVAPSSRPAESFDIRLMVDELLIG